MTTTNRLNNKKRDYYIGDFIATHMGGVIILVVIFVVTLVPTISVLTLSVTIPPSQDNVLIINERITFLESWSKHEKNTFGNKEVVIKIQRDNNIIWSDTYHIKEGQPYIIRTYRPLEPSDIVIVDIPEYSSFKRVFTIE